MLKNLFEIFFIFQTVNKLQAFLLVTTRWLYISLTKIKIAGKEWGKMIFNSLHSFYGER